MKPPTQPPVRAVQKFTAVYLDHCRKMSPKEIFDFLENFRRLNAAAHEAARLPSPSRLISIKIPEDLLQAFRAKAKASGTRYQTLIKKLMREYVIKN